MAKKRDLLYEAEAGKISIAVVGDAMLSRSLSPYREPHFLALADLLRGADLTIANLEFLFHNYESSWQWTGGTYTRSDPRNLQELKWLGIDAVFTANNHAFDFSEGGFLTTLRHLDEAHIPHAGGGIDLDHARAPAYVDLPEGRVAMMSGSSSYTEISRAGAGRSDFPGKPGINALRYRTEYQVPRDVFEALGRARVELGFAAEEELYKTFVFAGELPPLDEETQLRAFDKQFGLADEFGIKTSPSAEDMRGIGNWIRGAGKQAEWVIYGLHCHESGLEGDYHGGSRTSPPDFLHDFARWSIDQGCQLFAGHGPHFLRGIEIYKGKPIFYSLGNFIFQNDTITSVPAEAYARFKLDESNTPGDFFDTRSAGSSRGFPVDPVFWQSVVAVCDYEDYKLTEVRLYPVDLGFGKHVAQRGRPLLAEQSVAEQILDWVQWASRPYGTKIEVRGSVGYIHP